MASYEPEITAARPADRAERMDIMRYIITVRNPEKLGDKPFRDERGFVIDPASFKTNKPYRYTSQLNAENIADELNRHFPGSGASVKEIDPYRGLVTLEDMWRMGETPVI